MSSRMLRGAALCLAIAWAACAQSGEARVEFEVASVKQSAPVAPSNTRMMFGGPSGGPGTKDPGRFSANGTSIYNLLMQAYKVLPYQISTPDWVRTERYDITAKIPEGATREQFLVMLQNLLADRFKLTLHREQKELPMYDLVVAKNGPKLKEWEPPPVDPNQPPPSGPPQMPPPGMMGKPVLDDDGYPVIPTRPGVSSSMSMTNGKATQRMYGATMQSFALQAMSQVGKPVTDKTGLTGRYDITLHFATDGMMGGGMMGGGMSGAIMAAQAMATGAGGAAPAAADPSGPTYAEALVSQLGLRLEAKKGMVEILVIDHVEKVPTEN